MNGETNETCQHCDLSKLIPNDPEARGELSTVLCFARNAHERGDIPEGYQEVPSRNGLYALTVNVDSEGIHFGILTSAKVYSDE